MLKEGLFVKICIKTVIILYHLAFAFALAFFAGWFV